MFSLFKKKYIPITEYLESWSIIEERYHDTLVRINMGYKDAVGHPDYPIKMGIAIPVNDHNDAVMKVKSEIEDILDNVLKKRGNGSLVAIITGLKEPKFIEFLSYTKKGGVDFAKIHQDLKDKFPEYEVQMFAKPDTTWEAYKSFAHI